MTEPTILDFTSGATVAEEMKKKEDAARQAARGTSKYFSLKQDGETAILRFLIEADVQPLDRTRALGPDNPPDPATGWPSTKQHNFIKTKPAPRDKPPEANWQEKVTAVCRRTPVGTQGKAAYPDCYICDNVKNERGFKETPTQQLWTTACLREEVIGSQELVDEGRIHESQIGQRLVLDQMDYLDEMDEHGNLTGRKVWKKRVVIVNMAMTNFFAPLTSMAKYYGTILDRDYRIERKGEPNAKRVAYVPFPLDPYQVSVERDGQVVTIGYDLREPEIAALYAGHGPDRQELLKIITRKISIEYYNKYIDPRVEVTWKDFARTEEEVAGGKPAARGPDTPPPLPSQAQQEGKTLTAEPTAGPTADAIKAMREKVMASQGAAAPPVGAPPASPPPPLPVH